MPEAFDPYVEWLGFPAGRAPANHYELLGVPVFESDPEAIAHAADCLRGQFRKIRPGPQLALWQQLLDELNAAKACLLDPGAKAAYDASLRSQPAPAPVPAPPVAAPPTMAPPPASVPPLGFPPPAMPPGAVPASYPSGAPQGAWVSGPSPPAADWSTAPPAPAPPAAPPAPYPTYPAYPPQATAYGAPPQAPPGPEGYYYPPAQGYPAATGYPDAAAYAPATGYPAAPAPAGDPSAMPPGAPLPAPPGPMPPPRAQSPPCGQPSSYGQPPSYGAVPGYGPASGYEAPPQYGEPPQYGAAPPYGAAPVPPYGSAPPYGAAPTYEAAPSPAPLAAPVPQPPLGPAPSPDAAPSAGVVASRPAALPRRRSSAMVAVVSLALVGAAVALGLVLHGVLTQKPTEAARANGAQGPSGENSGKPGPGPEKPRPGEKPGPADKPDTAKPKPGEKPSPAEKPGPADKPDPAEKPQPKDQPDPAEKPKPKEEPKPPADPVKQAAWQKAVGEARDSLAEHDLESVEAHLARAAANAQTPQDHAVIERLQSLRRYLEQFWNGVRQSVATLQGGEELVVGDTRVAVVEADQEKLIIKAAGQLRRWPIQEIPASIVMPLAERWFHKDAPSRAALGAYMAVDPKGSPQRARQLLEEAAQAGLDVTGLMEELDQFEHGDRPASKGPGVSKPSARVPRVPVPTDAAKLQQAEQLVREAYKKEFEKTDTATDKFELARKLLAAAPGADDSPEARFVMFREARKLAVAAGKATTACEAVDGMAEHFEIDPLAMKLDTVTEAAEAARTLTGHKEAAQAAKTLGHEAIEAKKTDVARKAADLALEAARKSNSPTLVREAQALKQQADGGAKSP